MTDRNFEKIHKFHAPENAFVTCAVITAVGGFISLDKSELEGSTFMEFLGIPKTGENSEINSNFRNEYLH